MIRAYAEPVQIAVAKLPKVALGIGSLSDWTERSSLVRPAPAQGGDPCIAGFSLRITS